jgi:hypothetical protein
MIGRQIPCLRPNPNERTWSLLVIDMRWTDALTQAMHEDHPCVVGRPYMLTHQTGGMDVPRHHTHGPEDTCMGRWSPKYNILHF